MNRWLLSLLPFFTATLYSLPAHSASFDCQKASTKVEKMICVIPELSKLDEELAKQYKGEINSAKANQAKANQATDKDYDYLGHHRKDQIKWLTFQRDTCQTEACLIREYKERLGGKLQYGTVWDYISDSKMSNLPNSRAFGTFAKSIQIPVYDPDTKSNDIYDETNELNIISVTDKPYLAVIDSTMIFTNAHMCTIADELAKWSENHWVLNETHNGNTVELRLYPATYQGKDQLLLKDLEGKYRKINCGMRGYFDGLVFDRQ